ncbi:MAG: DUF1015 domain-containing protein [Thermaurantimonas sp.]|uniref:DUF1015 domain-containing protein n=1 Tax=Thermaurantimonas sp. TaxID=2681568 RepID=UPI003919F8F5
MIDFRPFKAIRPTRDKAYLVATRSYVSYNEQALVDKLNNNPYTFLHVINPTEARVNNIQGSDKYKLVRKTFQKFYRDGVFISDERPAYYLYRQSTSQHVFTGLIGAVSVLDYNEGRIKIHEHTLTRREEMFADYLYHTGFNAEPVLLMYPWQMKLRQVFERYLLMRPEYEFTSTDRVLHELWVIDDANSIETIQAVFSNIENVYIADGHHRSASSALLHKRLQNEGRTSSESGYFMAMMLPETELVIDSFFRLLENSSAEEQKNIEEFVHSSCQEISPNQPLNSGEISVFNGKEWKSYKIPDGWFVGKNAAKQLDASVLFDHILNPIAGITDAKESERLHYMPTPEGRKKAEIWAVEHPHSLVFELAPIDVETIKKISDLHLVMPPKSTYILPKLRSGLTIYDLNIH